MPQHVSSKVKQFLVFYNVKHITSRAYNPTGYSVVERSNHTFKMLIKKKRIKTHVGGLNSAVNFKFSDY